MEFKLKPDQKSNAIFEIDEKTSNFAITGVRQEVSCQGRTVFQVKRVHTNCNTPLSLPPRPRKWGKV